MEQYYSNLVASGNNWTRSYYGVFEKVIKDNDFKHVAEVGIGYGLHARSILDNTSIDKLYLIDPMQWYPNDAFPIDVINHGGFEELVKHIKLHLAKHESKYEWYRQTSTSVTNEQIPDESLDAVFIDADHSYEAVSADLPFWFKKLKKGGWLLGDDYKGFPGTKKAVDEFANKNSLFLEFLYKSNTKYPIYKFIKPMH